MTKSHNIPLIVKGDQGKCWAFMHTMLKSAQFAHFDHNSLNREQMLATTTKWYGVKCIWKLTKFHWRWDYFTFYRIDQRAQELRMYVHTDTCCTSLFQWQFAMWFYCYANCMMISQGSRYDTDGQRCYLFDPIKCVRFIDGNLPFDLLMAICHMIFLLFKLYNDLTRVKIGVKIRYWSAKLPAWPNQLCQIYF